MKCIRLYLKQSRTRLPRKKNRLQIQSSRKKLIRIRIWPSNNTRARKIFFITSSVITDCDSTISREKKTFLRTSSASSLFLTFTFLTYRLSHIHNHFMILLFSHSVTNFVNIFFRVILVIIPEWRLYIFIMEKYSIFLQLLLIPRD